MIAKLLPSLRTSLLLAAGLGALLSPLAGHADERGKEIYGPCAACHGEFGQGGKKGEYPRIAGQQAKYMESQLKALPEAHPGGHPHGALHRRAGTVHEDMKIVSEYVAGIELPTAIPTFKDTDDALTRLQAMEKVMIVPREPGDVEAGKAIYQKQCAACHGKTAKGRGMFPAWWASIPNT